MSSLPTFGIVTFRRPEKLSALVLSIFTRYRDADILIADNGRRLPAHASTFRLCWAHPNTFVLPFDCGLSESRNFLIQNSPGDLVILDDDFEFTAETSIESLQQVLAEDSEVGLVCGSASTQLPMEFDGPIAKPTSLERRRTSTGVDYQICHMADNFMLMRRAALNDGIRWNPGLKVGEHFEFFKTLRSDFPQWKVAYVPSCKVKHDRTVSDGEDYDRYRTRGPQLNTVLRKPHVPPCIVVLAAGHSGTRAVVRMIERLGWDLGEVKAGVAENLMVQQINKRLLGREGICPCGSDDTEIEGDRAGEGRRRLIRLQCRRCRQDYSFARVAPHEFFHAVADLRQPWLIKDPRLVLTFDYWRPVFEKYRPFLLNVERDLGRMRQTYERHGFGDFRIYGKDVPELVRLARWHFASWGERKLSVRYEDIASSVSVFDLGRAT